MWRISQLESRARYRAKFDAQEAARWDASMGAMSEEDQDAYLADLGHVVPFQAGMAVLDAGAGTGLLSLVLSRLEGLTLTALEPAPAMLDVLRGKPGLRHVTAVEGFCDAPEDRTLFGEGRFDVIASRQLINGLHDPLTAFANWHHWLKPGGAVVAIDGLYGRDAWTGAWEEEVDELPISACQSTALVPYMLETSGFVIEAVSRMTAVNARPTSRSTRYVVVARRPGNRKA